MGDGHADESQKYIQINLFKADFSALKDNKYVDIFYKRIALKAAPSVVGIKIYSDKQEIRCGSGFIIERETDGENFKCTILSSATLLRRNHDQNSLLHNLKLVVVASNHKDYQAHLVAHDFHYNLAAITFKMDHPLEVAKLRYLDDDLVIAGHDFQLYPHSDRFKLEPGAEVLALARSCIYETGIMTATGLYSIRKCIFDCKELLGSTCRITKCGIGGPTVNRRAEVIGVNFFDIGCTPFLPINIASKWYMHTKETMVNCRPWIGAETSNLYTIVPCDWEKITIMLPNLINGVVVDEITPNSPADFAKLLAGDFIVEFGGKVVRSSLQLYDLIWENVGKSVKLVVMRRTSNSHVDLTITVADIKDNDQLNSWPLEGGDGLFKDDRCKPQWY